jgi:hypothetical protein
VVERQLPKLYVVGSIPIARSNAARCPRKPEALDGRHLARRLRNSSHCAKLRTSASADAANGPAMEMSNDGTVALFKTRIDRT